MIDEREHLIVDLEQIEIDEARSRGVDLSFEWGATIRDEAKLAILRERRALRERIARRMEP